MFIPMIQEFLDDVAQWAQTQPDILAVALVGSHARGEASETSDIDLTLLCENPDASVNDPSWTTHFGQSTSIGIEDWGRLTSVRVFYQHGREVEFGFTDASWAALPLDSGTQKVVLNGFKIIFDRNGYFQPIEQFLSEASR